MVEDLYKKDVLLTGIDPGNITTKVSYLDESGKTENFTIPTVIAPAPAHAVAYNQQVDKNDKTNIEDFIHIRVDSAAMDKDENNRSWYVGENAKKSPDKVQPSISQNGDAEDKFSDSNRKVFVLPVLAGIAVSALKVSKRKVIAPLSTGIPSKGYLKHEQTLKQRFVGEHTITFIDGPYAGETVLIIIKDEEAQIHAESVTTAIALMYDIENGELVETELKNKLDGTTYVISDLGAGTSDYAVFNETGLDKVMTRRFAEDNQGEMSRIGTNSYIDRIIEAVYNDPAFEQQRSVIEKTKDDSRKPAELTSREIFMKKLIKPVIEESIRKGTAPKFTYSWARTKNVDITQHVLKEMKNYAELQSSNIELAWTMANTDHVVAVGGGVLFGHYGGLNGLEEKEVIIPDLLESQYFTSKAYLIVSYLMRLQVEQLQS
ncbi:hypothetical protein [Cytobacillus gottheilii]|uniref:Actin-like protein N-terminal domain-containing protein n=1 Tax=Cytobacillus gottheilii TaxID=859144 RepID=A0ABX8FIV7_9BACI|nr:hypothetical protein [Cytobacillus gottheilii]QVY63928.1 hypothetical protein J1899_22405 [Cytobacillus gottheilii]